MFPLLSVMHTTVSMKRKNGDYFGGEKRIFNNFWKRTILNTIESDFEGILDFDCFMRK